MPASTIGAAALPLLEQVAAHFPACQRPALVLAATDGGVLQQLRIERDILRLDTPKRSEPLIALAPAQHVVHAAQQRGWQPPACSSAVEEARCAVAEIGGSAATTIAFSLQQRLVNLLAAMLQMQSMMEPASLCHFLTHQGDAGRLGTRVQFEHDGLELACVCRAVLEPDRKGLEAMDDRLAAGEQESRPLL